MQPEKDLPADALKSITTTALALIFVFPSPAIWGQVDLSGTYDVATLTPLQRPAQLGERATITEAEAKAFASRFTNAIEADSAPSDPNREAPPEGGTEFVLPEFEGAAGGVGGYNTFYIDVGEGTFKLDGEYRTSIITSPANGRRPAFTDAGKAEVARRRANYNENTGTAWWLERGVGPYDNPEDRPLAERCILGFGSTAGPPALPVLYNNLKRIIQTPEYVIIVNEMNHDTRVIPITQPGAELTDSAKLPSWLGNSIGYWEDETLVIETRDFREQPALSLATAALQVEERLSRIDANTLRYRFKVTDPNWTESWEGEYPWPATDAKMFEYACHEGNYALGGILRGARLLEQEAMGNPISPGGQE